MSKNYFAILGAICILSFSSFIYSKNQEETILKNEACLDTGSSFYYVLDNRFQGGSDAFIEEFEKYVSYPQEAFDNCRLGLAKISAKITVDGKLEDLKFLNPLGFGIEEKLQNFFDKTSTNWKAWARSSNFEMTVGFSLITSKDSYYPDADLLVLEKSAYRWATDNKFCDPDAKIQKRIKKYFKKKKYEKAIPFIEELMRRYPDNTEYPAQKKTAEANKK